MLNDLLNTRLEARLRENSFRRLTVQEGLVDFTSNDYLGLARSEELFESINAKLNTLPHRNGAAGSRLLSGNDAYTQEVEQKLAQIFQGESALIFNSGYAANQAILSCVPQKGDTILYDELAHACIRDGARLSFASHFSFQHNNPADLEKKLKQATGNIFIVVESIYSMDGDQCPLEEIISLANAYSAHIMIDEAHSTGVLGLNGSGYAESKKLHTKIGIRVYTFGKAMGCHGACVVGSRTMIDYLINFARPFIFTTALPVHSIAAIDCSFEYVSKHMQLQEILKQKVKLFAEACAKKNISILKSTSQIQGIVIPGNDRVKKIAEQLQTNGFDVRPILSPTVPKGSERLRICLHTFNTDEDINNLVQQLSSAS